MCAAPSFSKACHTSTGPLQAAANHWLASLETLAFSTDDLPLTCSIRSSAKPRLPGSAHLSGSTEHRQAQHRHKFQHSCTICLKRNQNAIVFRETGFFVIVVQMRKQTVSTKAGNIRRLPTNAITAQCTHHARTRKRSKKQAPTAISCPHVPDQATGVTGGCKHCQARVKVSLVRQSAWHRGIHSAQCLDAARTCAPVAEPLHKVDQGVGRKLCKLLHGMGAIGHHGGRVGGGGEHSLDTQHHGAKDFSSLRAHCLGKRMEPFPKNQWAAHSRNACHGVDGLDCAHQLPLRQRFFARNQEIAGLVRREHRLRSFGPLVTLVVCRIAC